MLATDQTLDPDEISAVVDRYRALTGTLVEHQVIRDRVVALSQLDAHLRQAEVSGLLLPLSMSPLLVRAEVLDSARYIALVDGPLHDEEEALLSLIARWLL